jgi:hypothetical protein
MARRKNKPESVQEKNLLAERLRSIRVELFGERGGSEMARRLGLPVRTWYNYESGVTIPAEIILRFMELTSVEPMWLLHGRGARYRSGSESRSNSGGDSVRDLLRIALQRLEQRDTPPDLAMLPSRTALSPARRRGTAGSPTLTAPVEPEMRSSVERDPLAVGPFLENLESPTARPALLCVRVDGDSMAPILSDGAYVVYSEHEDPPQRLAGQLVVAWVDGGEPRVRWFELSGRYGILRAENPHAEPQSLLLDLHGASGPEFRLRRVVGTSTPH